MPRVRPGGVATGPLPLVDPSRELARRVLLRGSWSLPFHLPAALRSTGVTPLRHYYGDSDCCPAPLARIPARTALIRCAHPSRGHPPGALSPLRSGSMRPHDTFPAFSPQPSSTARFSPVYEGCGRKRLPLMRQASPFARRLAAVVNRTLVHSRLGPQVRLGLLPTPSRDDAVASGCFPVARLGMTQTFTG